MANCCRYVKSAKPIRGSTNRLMTLVKTFSNLLLSILFGLNRELDQYFIIILSGVVGGDTIVASLISKVEVSLHRNVDDNRTANGK